MRSLIIAGAALLAACNGQPSGADTAASASGAPVEQGQPNVPEFSPAFEGQTRAPERLSGVTLNVETVAEGLEHPWAVAELPGGRFLVTEKPGRLRIVNRNGQVSAPIAGLPAVDARGQGGLLDVALAPDFATSRMIYWSYAEPRGNNRNSTSVARGALSADFTRVENAQVIFRQEPAWESTYHFGSRLVWDRDGHLYITTGERSNLETRVMSQDINTHIGKVIRINADGSTPADNPFVGRSDARSEIWSYGHRNIQGAALHPETGQLWTIEHGPKGGDELNAPKAGRNYGWPVITYGEEYSGQPIGESLTQREGMEQPVYYWDPVIAPGGMLFYDGTLFADWRGDVLIASLGGGLVRLELDGERVTGEERLMRDAGRLRDIAQGSDGALYIVTDEDEGRLLRVTPNAR